MQNVHILVDGNARLPLALDAALEKSHLRVNSGLDSRVPLFIFLLGAIKL